METGERGRPNIPTQTLNVLASFTVPQIPKLKVGALSGKMIYMTPLTQL